MLLYVTNEVSYKQKTCDRIPIPQPKVFFIIQKIWIFKVIELKNFGSDVFNLLLGLNALLDYEPDVCQIS